MPAKTKRPSTHPPGTTKRARWDSAMKIMVVTGEQSTSRTIARTVDTYRRRIDKSLYSVAKDGGVTRDSVVRMLSGYRSSRQDGEDGPGRVRLVTFLAILESLGLDVEIVARQGTVRSLV